MKTRLVFAAVAVLAAIIGSTRLAGAQPQSVVVTNPSSDVAFEEADEYSTLVWNDPWDMSQSFDISQLDSAALVYPNHFSVFPCTPGLWCATAVDNNPDLFLLTPGYSGALHVGRDGNLHSINASVYTRLTFRMYLDQAPVNNGGWQVQWTNGTVADLGHYDRAGQSYFFPLYSGWNIYSIDLTMKQILGIPWSGNLTGIRLDIGSNGMAGHTVEFDWARLTGPNGDNRTISWSANGESGNVGFSFMSSDGTSTPYHNNIVRTISGTSFGDVEAVPVSAGSYAFHGSLPPDNWRVGVTAQNTATSNGRWLIHPAPTLGFVKPSYTSGDDYSTVVLGSPWNMNAPGDITLPFIVHHSFANGILSGQNVNTDPRVLFLRDPLPGQYNIDTSRFRYATFRMLVDGVPDISNGSITRLFWFTNNKSCGETNDIPLHEDWNVVSLDLWDNNILDDQAGGAGCLNGWRANSTRNQFRLDPDEIPAPGPFFHLDYVLLTAMDTANASSNFPIEYKLGTAGDSVTFYYNTTRSTAGRHLARGSGQAALAQGAAGFRVFLPTLFKQVAVNNPPPGAQTFLWSLAGVSPNTYYLSADVSDAFKTVTWFSDTPVVVTP